MQTQTWFVCKQPEFLIQCLVCTSCQSGKFFFPSLPTVPALLGLRLLLQKTKKHQHIKPLITLLEIHRLCKEKVQPQPRNCAPPGMPCPSLSRCSSLQSLWVYSLVVPPPNTHPKTIPEASLSNQNKASS